MTCEYPIIVRLFVSQSPQNYKLIDGKIEQYPRYFAEKLSVKSNHSV